MKLNIKLLLGLLMFASISQSFAATPDFEREKRLADEIVDVILDGDVLWLKAGGREFLTLYTQAQESIEIKSKVAVMILHGRGFHPDWQEVVNPLRVGLAEQGYATLSLQMPVLIKKAKYYDYVPIFNFAHARIEAAITFLQAKSYDKIVILAHSCGAHMAMDWIDLKGDADIAAFIGLSMSATDYKQPMLKPYAFAKVKVPLLDLYGGQDFPAVIRLAPERKAAVLKAANQYSQQQVITDADHYFTDHSEQLIEAVTIWLDRLYSTP